MPHVTESIVIDRTPEEVWTHVTDPTRTPRWNPMFSRQEIVGAATLAPGVVLRSEATVAGRHLVSASTVTVLDEPRRSSLSGDDPFPYTADYLLEPVGGGTLLTWHLHARPGLGGAFGPLPDGLVVRIAASQVRAALRRLRRQLESAPAFAQAR